MKNIVTVAGPVVLITFIAVVAAQINAAVSVVPALDKAIAHQCANHDWPTDKHQVHMAWCAANGYATN